MEYLKIPHTEDKDVQLNIAAGKNYCCGDINGMEQLYRNIKEYLGTKDTLWILGDATSYGVNGIEILQDIMKSSEKNGSGPQVKYIFGNHDLILLQCIDIFKKTGMTDEAIVEYFNRYQEVRGYWNKIKKELGRYPKEEEMEEYEKGIQATKDRIAELEKNMGEDEKKFISHNCFYNEAWCTVLKFYTLSKEEQEKIYKFLENTPLMVTRQFGDQKVLLVHSGPPIAMAPNMRGWPTYKDVKENPLLTEKDREGLIDSIVWDRPWFREGREEPLEKRYERWKNEGYRIIHGHTITESGEVELGLDGTISIDIGAKWIKEIALYCIEDNEVTYISQSGKIKKGQCKEVSRSKRQDDVVDRE